MWSSEKFKERKEREMRRGKEERVGTWKSRQRRIEEKNLNHHSFKKVSYR